MIMRILASGFSCYLSENICKFFEILDSLPDELRFFLAEKLGLSEFTWEAILIVS